MRHPDDLPEDFFAEDHYPTCPVQDDESAVCDCDEETRRIRDDFKAARYELDRGN